MLKWNLQPSNPNRIDSQKCLINPLGMKSLKALLVLALLGLVTSSVQSADKKLVVGFSQIGAESAWRSAETESIRSEAAKRGVGLKMVDAQQKQENQIKALRTFIAQDVDAIILAPVVETGWEPVLR